MIIEILKMMVDNFHYLNPYDKENIKRSSLARKYERCISAIEMALGNE